MHGGGQGFEPPAVHQRCHNDDVHLCERAWWDHPSGRPREALSATGVAEEPKEVAATWSEGDTQL